MKRFPNCQKIKFHPLNEDRQVVDEKFLRFQKIAIIDEPKKVDKEKWKVNISIIPEKVSKNNCY